MIPDEVVQQANSKAIFDVARLCGAQLRKVGAEWNGPCPACGGRDRFWLNEGKNTFLCRMSGAAGGPLMLLMHQHQCTFPQAVAMLTGESAIPEAKARERQVDDNVYREKARRRAYVVWQSGKSVEPGRGGYLVERYFARRRIPFPNWQIRTLRETTQLAYWHWSKRAGEFQIIHKGPAMLAAVTGPDGHFMGVHRTWLDLNHRSGKAVIADPETGEILPSKKVEGSQRGGRIVLRDGDPEAVTALGEGIETVLSWASLRAGTASKPYRQPGLICGVNLDNIAGKAAEQVAHPSLTTTDSLGRQRRIKVGGPVPALDDTDCLQLEPGPAGLILLGDGDSDRFTTQAAMIRAQRRHEARGFQVEIDWAIDGKDFNTMLREPVEVVSKMEHAA